MKYLILCAATALLPVAATAQRASDPQPSAVEFKSMDEAMTAGAARAVQLAAGSGISLDYSPGSVEIVEQQLGKLHEVVQASANDPTRKLASPSDQEIRLMSYTFGSYIAEVLKRKYGGTWSTQSALYPGKEIPTFHVGANRMDIWPQIKVEKRLRNGPEDNVWHYFQLTQQKLESK
jgi:hypothetical protein